jgi:hypothetical protein
MATEPTPERIVDSVGFTRATNADDCPLLRANGFPATMARRRSMGSTTFLTVSKTPSPTGYTDEQWQSIAEHLGENVQNGLT